MVSLLPMFTTYAVDRWKALFETSPENANTLAELLAELSHRAFQEEKVSEGWHSTEHKVQQIIKNGLGVVYETRRNDAGQPELIVVSVFPVPESNSLSSSGATEG